MKHVLWLFFYFIGFKLNKQTQTEARKQKRNERTEKNGKSSAINDTYPHRNMKSIFFRCCLAFDTEKKKKTHRAQHTLHYNVNEQNKWNGTNTRE